MSLIKRSMSKRIFFFARPSTRTCQGLTFSLCASHAIFFDGPNSKKLLYLAAIIWFVRGLSNIYLSFLGTTLNLSFFPIGNLFSLLVCAETLEIEEEPSIIELNAYLTNSLLFRYTFSGVARESLSFHFELKKM